MTPIFREAQVHDVPAILRLLADDDLGAGRETAPTQTYMQAFGRISADPNAVIVVAEADGDLIACCQLNLIDGLSHNAMRRGQLEDVRVASHLRGQGIGRALIDHVVDRARRAGCTSLQLVAHVSRQRTREFYESVGFTTTHLGFKRSLI